MKKSIWLLVILIVCVSCEQEVDLKLKNSEPLVFIESWIRTDSAYQRVWVRKTNDFQASNNYPGANNALVILSDDKGNIDTLQNIENGIFRTSKPFPGLEQTHYTLQVYAEGKHYEATAFMPSIVRFDTAFYQYVNDNNLVKEPGYYVTTIGREPLGLNYYRVLCFKNDSLFNGVGDYFVTDDILVDGNIIINALPFKFDKGDTAKVELWNIDQRAFYYFVSLFKQLIAGGPFAPPADNVKGNFSNGALGFFGACAVHNDTLIIE